MSDKVGSSEIKLDPTIKLQDDVITEKEIEKTNKKLNFDPNDKKTPKNSN